MDEYLWDDIKRTLVLVGVTLGATLLGILVVIALCSIAGLESLEYKCLENNNEKACEMWEYEVRREKE